MCSFNHFWNRPVAHYVCSLIVGQANMQYQLSYKILRGGGGGGGWGCRTCFGNIWIFAKFLIALHGVSQIPLFKIWMAHIQGFQLLGIAWREKHRARNLRTHEWGPGPPSAYHRSLVGSRGKALDRGEGSKATPLYVKKILHLRISKCIISGPFSV